jgi:hypothetical protein
MLFAIKPSAKSLAASLERPRITPDPSQAAALERKFQSLNYHPQNGFHRDRAQDRMMTSRRAMR